ncbi:MAG: prolyl-tRNA synthetase associated domain-containing protein [Candidatus Peribacteraceae bacterium]
MDQQQLLALLDSLGIPFQKFDHKAVFTCAESEGIDEHIPGAHTKQLLMKAKRTGKLVLAIVMHDKRVDTKALAKEIGDQSFSFASPELLMEKLGVTPGSVTPFGLVLDKEHTVEVIVDEDAWKVGQFRFHPMTNTATCVIDKEGFEALMKHTGHSFTVRKIPSIVM